MSKDTSTEPSTCRCRDRPGFEKSSYSSGSCTCVEVKLEPDEDRVLIRDSKYDGDLQFEPFIVIHLAIWMTFLDEVSGLAPPGANGVVFAREQEEGFVHLQSQEVTLRFNSDEWRAFVAGARDGEFRPSPVPA